MLLVLKGLQDFPPPPCTGQEGQEVVVTVWRTSSGTCRVLGSEVFLVLLVLKVLKALRVHQAATLEPLPTVGTSLVTASALNWSTI